MSEVNVDEAALAAEASAVVNALPPVAPVGDASAPVDPSQPSPEQVKAGYKLVCDALVSRGFDVMAPAWNVTPVETGRIGDATADALLLWFPDQIIPPKYLALLVVAGVTMEVIDARRDPQTGQLRPRTNAKPVATKTPPASPASEAA